MNMKYFLSILLISFSIEVLGQNPVRQDEDIKPPEYVTDIDGNQNPVATIGDQVWLAENLRTLHFNNGDPIPTTYPITRNIQNKSLPVYQWSYEGVEKNLETYGALYTWAAANDERGLCPPGWHIPSKEEWNKLFEYLGGHSEAGGKMKEAGSQHWSEPNVGATNESGFNALPSGGKAPEGSFQGIGVHTSWWMTTPGHFINIEYDDPYVYHPYFYQSEYYCFPARCIRDNR